MHRTYGRPCGCSRHQKPFGSQPAAAPAAAAAAPCGPFQPPGDPWACGHAAWRLSWEARGGVPVTFPGADEVVPGAITWQGSPVLRGAGLRPPLCFRELILFPLSAPPPPSPFPADLSISDPPLSLYRFGPSWFFPVSLSFSLSGLPHLRSLLFPSH